MDVLWKIISSDIINFTYLGVRKLLTSTPWEETVAAQIDQVLPNPEE
jgi:hypothetical protein